jgi:hypothetical protein
VPGDCGWHSITYAQFEKQLSVIELAYQTDQWTRMLMKEKAEEDKYMNMYGDEDDDAAAAAAAAETEARFYQDSALSFLYKGCEAREPSRSARAVQSEISRQRQLGSPLARNVYPALRTPPVGMVAPLQPYSKVSKGSELYATAYSPQWHFRHAHGLPQKPTNSPRSPRSPRSGGGGMSSSAAMSAATVSQGLSLQLDAEAAYHAIAGSTDDITMDAHSDAAAAAAVAAAAAEGGLSAARKSSVLQASPVHARHLMFTRKQLQAAEKAGQQLNRLKAQQGSGASSSSSSSSSKSKSESSRSLSVKSLRDSLYIARGQQRPYGLGIITTKKKAPVVTPSGLSAAAAAAAQPPMTTAAARSTPYSGRMGTRTAISKVKHFGRSRNDFVRTSQAQFGTGLPNEVFEKHLSHKLLAAESGVKGLLPHQAGADTGIKVSLTEQGLATAAAATATATATAAATDKP